MEPLGPLALVILLVPGITLLMALRIFYRKQVVTSNVARLALSLTAWLLIWLAALGAGIGSLALLSFYYMPVAIIAVLMMIDRFRRSEHHALLNTLAFAAEKGIPLSEAARAYSQENSGDAGVRALYLAERIEAGATLSAATRFARLRLATPMRLAVNLSDVVTARGLTLRSQLNWGSESDAAFRTIINRLLYLAVMFQALLMILTFVMIKIVPVYQRMFEEFGISLPPLTEIMIQLSKSVVRGGWMFIVPLLVLGVVGLFIGMFYYTGWYDFPVVRGGQSQERYASRPDVMRIMDLGLGLRLFFWRYDASLVLRSLSLLMEQNIPLPQALMLLANVYPRGNVRRRLTNAALEVDQGRDWKSVLRRQWLVGPAEVAVLAAAERAGNLPWALDETGDSLMRRLTYRLMLVHQIIYPILLLLFGGFVAFFCLGMMLPLISLIQGLA